MGFALSHLLNERTRNQACIHEYEHVWADLTEQAGGSMHFGDVIAVHLFSSIADKRFSLREIQCKPHDTLLDIGFGSGALLPQTVGIVTVTALST